MLSMEKASSQHHDPQVGALYGAEYVNRVYRGVKAHLGRPFRFVCVTDDRAGLADGIEPVSFPEGRTGSTRTRAIPNGRAST